MRCGTVLVCVVLGLVMRVEARPSGSAARLPATILVDATSGEVLREQDAAARRPAGSLNQLMVLLLSLEEGRLGAVAPDTPVIISAEATNGGAAANQASRSAARAACNSAAGNRLSVSTEKEYALSDLLKAMVIGSANEAAVAVAQAAAGSVAECLELMNARAQSLGMEATHYASVGGRRPVTASGCDTTSARDVARLAQAVLHDPRVLQWASLGGLPFDGGSILLRNINQLLGTVRGVDGLHVSSSPPAWHRPGSFSIVATAQRGALRLIAVVLDAPSSAVRYSTAVELLEWGFAEYERLEVVKEGEPLSISIYVVDGGYQLTPVAGQSFSLLRRRGEERSLQIRYQVPTVLSAPVKRHEKIGEIIVEGDGQLLAMVPVLSPATIGRAGILAAGLP